MKVSASLFPKKNKKAKTTKKITTDTVLIGSALVIGLGLILGVLSYGLNESLFSNELYTYFFEFNYNFANKSFLEISSGILLSNMIYFAVMTVMGTSAVGSYFVMIPTLIKSLGIGTLVCYLYMSYELTGVEYCFLVLFPGKIILLFTMLILTQTSFKMSNEIKNQLNRNTAKKIELKKFFISIVLIFGFFVLSTVIDSLMIYFFGGLFEF